MLLHSQKIIKQKGSLDWEVCKPHRDKQIDTHTYTPGLKMTQQLRRLFSTHVEWLTWPITPGNLMPLALTHLHTCAYPYI